MPALRLGVPRSVPPDLAGAMVAVRAELGVPEAFPPEVIAAARQAARRPPSGGLDRTDLDLLTIDPPGSVDLDQALQITRAGSGYVVWYAIADVAAFVTAGDPVDAEARRRGLTRYAPDLRTPLHPPALSEGVASLLPGQRRPALLWTIRLDGEGGMTAAEVVRADVRSRAQLDYTGAQAEIDAGSARPTLALLAEVGRLREQRERDRGGVSLRLPEQQVNTATRPWSLEFRAPLPVEGWNAQISLLTGMAAAHLMLYGQVGILRTLPPAEPSSLRRLHQVAKALRLPWPAELDYPEFVRRLDPSRSADAAMLTSCARLFRGAGYAAFNGDLPVAAEHAALAIDYAHVTAPLRRRVDRYAGEICLALCADRPVPEWVLQALDGLPEEMRAAERQAKQYERAILDRVEAALLANRVGETFVATLIEVDAERERGTVMIREPAIEAPVSGGDLPLGQESVVRLTGADSELGRVTFELVEVR